LISAEDFELWLQGFEGGVVPVRREEEEEAYLMGQEE